MELLLYILLILPRGGFERVAAGHSIRFLVPEPVRHLIEQHHGEIDATSDGPGLGTTVHIRLPLPADGVLPRR